MKSGLYLKLSVNGIKKNKKLYLPYLITCICMVMMFYLIDYLAVSPQFAKIKGGDTMQMIFGFGSGVISIFSLILLYYTNSFLIRRRQREFGLYHILGMGKIDLVKGENGTVEIVDFKSEKKPDLVKHADRLEQYRRQLHLYAHLIEERTGQKVSKMHLYYTGEENGVPTITYPYTKTAIDGTVAAFEDTVHKIMRKEYKHCASDIKVCKNCDFRFYCQNQ